MEEHVNCNYDYLAIISKNIRTKNELELVFVIINFWLIVYFLIFLYKRFFRTIPEFSRICRKQQLDNRISFGYIFVKQIYFLRYDSAAYIYFSTDHSRTFEGFKLDYYLCKLHLFWIIF